MNQTMDIAQKLISVIRSEVGDRKSVDNTAEIDKLREQVYNYAKRNNLQTFVSYYFNKNNLEEGFHINDFYIACTLIQWENGISDRISSVLNKHQIKHVFVKGESLRKYYPKQWMRLSGDIDVLISFNDKNKAIKCLMEEGDFTLTKGKLVSRSGGVSLDIKTSLGVPYHCKKVNKVYQRIWENVEVDEENGRPCLNDGMEYFNTVVHALKHLENGGCGIAHILDIWILNHKKDRTCIKKSIRNELLKQGGIKRAEEVLVSIAEKWFSGTNTESDYSELESFIINGNAFGDNRNKVLAIRAEKGRFGVTINKLFVSYSYLKQLFPQLEGRQWLLPFYEVRRWVYHIRGNRIQTALGTIKDSFLLEQKEIDKAKLFIKQLYYDEE